MFETTFELVSPLSPDELAARFRSEFFESQAECNSFWSCYQGWVDEQGFKLIVKGKGGMMAQGTFESGSPTRVRVSVDRYIGMMILAMGLFLAMAVAAVMWVFWDDWKRDGFKGPMVMTLVGTVAISLPTLAMLMVLSWVRYRGIKSKLTQVFVPDDASSS